MRTRTLLPCPSFNCRGCVWRGEKVETVGSDVPLGRAGQPNAVAPCYVFLAYMTGQVLHPNGGEIING